MIRPLQLVVSDQLAETARLTTEQYGALMLLRLHFWANRCEPLPDADMILARLVNLAPPHWRRAVRPVVAPFFTIGAAGWRDERLEAAWRSVDNLSVKRPLRRRAAAGYAEPTLLLPLEGGRVAAEAPLVAPQPPPVRVETIDEEFDALWPQFPRRIGKGAARIAYARARKKADKLTLAGAVARFAAAADQRESHFIPHPATWLNQERWLDEGENERGAPDGPGSNGARAGDATRRQSARGRGLSALARSTADLLGEISAGGINLGRGSRTHSR